jgi:phage gpG-like protein
MYKFEITDADAVSAFNRLIALGQDPSGMLMGIGEVATDFTKRRFELSADPYGEPWEPNSDATLRKMLHDGSGTFTKKGKLSAKGGKMLAGKKPLIGESKTLSTQIHPTVIGNDGVVVASSAVQAAMQHFGGTKSQFPHLWGDIPARPIFPDESRGLPDELNQDIADVLRAALQSAIGG